MSALGQQIANGLVLGGIYALIALGYTMVYGILQMINFAHGEVLMLGALASYSAVIFLMSVAPHLAPHWVLLVAILVAMVTACSVSLLIERFAYRPLRTAPRLVPLITAIGVSILAQAAAMLLWGRSPVTYPNLIPGAPLQWGSITVTRVNIVIIVLSSVAMIALGILVNKTGIGRAMRATSENPRVADLVGIDTNRVVVSTFAIGAALAGLAGVMIALNYSIAQFSMGALPGMKAFIAAVLGGIGNIYGAMLGGILLGIVESLGAGYIGTVTGGVLGSNYQDVFAFLVLILVLTLRPQGLMGERTADRA